MPPKTVIFVTTIRVKEFSKALTFSAAGKQRYPDKNLTRPVHGFFINNYSSNEVWVNWDEDADVNGKRGDRIEAGDYRNIALKVSRYISVATDGAADSVLLIGYREEYADSELLRASGTGAAARGIGYQDTEDEEFKALVLKARR